MRAQFCAATLFIANVGNLIIAPQLVGFLSDAFAPDNVANGESLRLAMLCLVPFGLWAVWHYFAATKKISTTRSARRASGRRSGAAARRALSQPPRHPARRATRRATARSAATGRRLRD